MSGSRQQQFAALVVALPRVERVEAMGTGLDVYVEGEPVYIEDYGPDGLVREDFTFTVNLGAEPAAAVAAFDRMLDTPVEVLRQA